MAINVAGTNAIGDYLVSEIANTRTLFGLAPETSALPVSSVPSSTSSTRSTAGATSAASTQSALETQVLAQKVANAQTLFGIPTSTTQTSGALPVDPNQTPQQIAFASIQSTDIASEFSNTATLFGSLGLGNNTNANA